MAEGRSSILVHILVIALCLTAFGFAIAAERRRSTVLIPRLLSSSAHPRTSEHPLLSSRACSGSHGCAEIWGSIPSLVLWASCDSV